MSNITESVAEINKIGLYVDEGIYNIFIKLIFFLILIILSLLMMLTLKLMHQVTSNRRVMIRRRTRCLQVNSQAKKLNLANIV